jgi:lipoprotein-anchoring transpeptidase ErfK/SrfK
MSVRTRALRLFALMAATMMLALSAGFAWSVVDDYGRRDIVPAGVSLSDGTLLAGLPRNDAHDVIEERLAATFLKPLEVRHGSEVFVLDPGTTLSFDVDAMVDAAFDPSVTTTVAERTLVRLTGEHKPVAIEPAINVDGDGLDAWVADIASRVDSEPLDASISIVEGAVVMRTDAPGARTDREDSVARIVEALLAGEGETELTVKPVAPAVSAQSLGKTIVVRLSQRKLYLYDGMDLEKSFGVAIGTPSHPTPRGTWEITQKRYLPTWGNPGSAWAANMPATIGPGPNNPLGTRALNLNASGIRIHGTTANSSIGTAASHGCMRMHRWDIEDLYDRVEVGTPVLIVR